MSLQYGPPAAKPARQVVLTDRLRKSTGETGIGLRTTLTDTPSSSQTVVSLHSAAVTSAAPRAPRRQECCTPTHPTLVRVQPVAQVPEACLTPQDRNVWRLRAVTEVTSADMSNCRFGRGESAPGRRGAGGSPPSSPQYPASVSSVAHMCAYEPALASGFEIPADCGGRDAGRAVRPGLPAGARGS